MYAVKEVFLTLQGEGRNAGRAAVFCRFTGCNLWSGLETDRADAVCNFCDTDFVGTNGTGGGKFRDADSLASQIDSQWIGSESSNKLVVFTGGEPLLQLDTELVVEMHRRNFQIAVETNGTVTPPAGIDWLCVSPKSDARLVVTRGDELKLVYPQDKALPCLFENLNFNHFYLQPMDSADRVEHTKAAIDYCLRHPKWSLSTQVHKMLGIR